jgi:predicted MPP superfamily phosphohydrolase
LNDSGRFALFLVIVLGTWTLMHVYVLWRAWSLPGLATPAAHRAFAAAAVFLWLSYPLGRIAAHFVPRILAYPLEFLGAVWMGALFLALSALLAVDAVTLFGLLLPRWAPLLRLAAFCAAGLLSAAALIQGLRPPVLRQAEVALPGLDRSLDGTVLVQISDVHLGTLLGARWTAAITTVLDRAKPHLILVTGDLIDGDAAAVAPLVPALRAWKAPLGTYFVTGNHEFYAGLDRCIPLVESAGMTVLRDRAQEIAPGLVLAGVDDLSAWRQFRMDGDPVARALENHPPGVLVFLSHSPLEAEKAASLGAGLMLSGHTHDGQICPFGLLVRVFYPFLRGRYAVGGMTLLVSRGSGTWGPPMRLFAPCEVWRITLRTAPAS